MYHVHEILSNNLSKFDVSVYQDVSKGVWEKCGLCTILLEFSFMKPVLNL